MNKNDHWGPRWDSFARTQIVISYLHDIWLKIKVLKCYMESMSNVTCLACCANYVFHQDEILLWGFKWLSFINVLYGIMYNVACCACVFHAWHLLQPTLNNYIRFQKVQACAWWQFCYIRFQKVQACAWWQFCENLWPCIWNLCMSNHPMCI